MALLNFRSSPKESPRDAALPGFLDGFSIEVMPRTAEKIADFRAILPAGTQVFIAHIEGTPFDDMLATAARLAREGFAPVPHFPARIIPDRATLQDRVARYRDAGVRDALLLGGGVNSPAGEYDSSMQLLDTGLFGDFRHLFVAGHPEGNRDIDRDGSDKIVMEALGWKQEFARRTGAEMAMVTQFCFEPDPVIAWADRLQAAGIGLPIRIGVAGPAKLQTMLKFAIACGVGPSLRVLQRRAKDVTKLLTPFEPDDFLNALARHKAANPQFGIDAVHFFPLGGITATTDWVARATAD